MAGLTEFDIVGVAPHVDLVLFDNVISCYPYNRSITANYTLGEAVRPSHWDWIGIFPADWQYLGQYITYCWAPDTVLDCTSPRRRAISINAARHGILPADRKEYQFLYVADGRHVAGVSLPFRVTEEAESADMYLTVLFREPVIPMTRAAKRKAIKKRILEAKKRKSDKASLKLVDETTCSAVPKRRSAGKQKITNVYRDQTSLIDAVKTDWTHNLQIVRVDEDHPVVKDFSSALVPYQTPKHAKLYDTRWSNNTNRPSTSQQPIMALSFQDIPSIEFPTFLSLPTGPQAFTLSVQNSRDTCPSCTVAKTLIQDLAGREEALQTKVTSLEKQLKDMRNLYLKQKDTSGSNNTRTLLDWCLRQVQKDNLSLKTRNVELESLLAKARDEKPVAISPMEDYDRWMVMEPKRIVRFKKTVGKQSRHIQLLREVLDNKHAEIARLREDNSNLRSVLQITKENSDNFRRLADDLDTKIKTVLADRVAQGTNEWQPSKTIKQETTTTQTPSGPEPERQAAEQTTSRDHIKNKQISKLIRSERNRKTKLHKERSQAEECPTCGIKFSKKADRLVIEEHMTYHKRYQ